MVQNLLYNYQYVSLGDKQFISLTFATQNEFLSTPNFGDQRSEYFILNLFQPNISILGLMPESYIFIAK